MIVAARAVRRPVRTVPTWWTVPALGAVKVVTIAVFVTLAVLERIGTGFVGVAVGVGPGLVVPVPELVPLLAGAAGVTAFDAAETTEFATGVVVFAIAVKV